MPDMTFNRRDMLVAKEGSSVQEALEFVKKLPHICPGVLHKWQP